MIVGYKPARCDGNWTASYQSWPHSPYGERVVAFVQASCVLAVSHGPTGTSPVVASASTREAELSATPKRQPKIQCGGFSMHQIVRAVLECDLKGRSIEWRRMAQTFLKMLVHATFCAKAPARTIVEAIRADHGVALWGRTGGGPAGRRAWMGRGLRAHALS